MKPHIYIYIERERERERERVIYLLFILESFLLCCPLKILTIRLWLLLASISLNKQLCFSPSNNGEEKKWKKTKEGKTEEIFNLKCLDIDPQGKK